MTEQVGSADSGSPTPPSGALRQLRSNVEFYERQVVDSQKRLADALEKHQHERKRLEERLDEDIERRDDFTAVLRTAEQVLAAPRKEVSGE